MAKKKKGGGRRNDDEAEIQELVMRHLDQFSKLGGPIAKEDLKEVAVSEIQRTWGDLGTINEVVLSLATGEERSAVVKIIKVPDCSSVGNARKRDSYIAEANFLERGYAEALTRAGAPCPAPVFFERAEDGSSMVMCMSRLEGVHAHRLSDRQLDAVLLWLARVHATFWGSRADEAVTSGGLQPQGCYWYLDTRLEELARMPTEGWEGRLRLMARALDERLKADRCQTLVHGDAKPDNMVFSVIDGQMSVAFCDFQYTGKAHPAKDLCYCLLGVGSGGDEAYHFQLLDRYLGFLSPLLEAQGDVPPTPAELRAVYGLCLCDLARWFSGWGWIGWERELRQRCRSTMDAIDGGRSLGSEDAYREAIFAKFPV